MKKYLGVKIVQAEPALKGWNQEESKQLSVEALQEGYKVVYEDGYVSWSPKDVFEKAYKEVPKEANDKLGLLVDPKTAEWEVVGHVAKLELGFDNFNLVGDSDGIVE